MNYLVQLTEDNFNVEETKYKSYDHFKQVVQSLGIDPKYFFKDEENPINRYWYIESFITIPFACISEDMLKFYNLGEMVKHRREHIDSLLEEENYRALLTLVDKPLRAYCLMSLIDTIPKEQFTEVFKSVWSTIEGSYTYLSDQEILSRLKDNTKDTLNHLQEQGVIISDKNTIVVYRGENDGSNHYLDGALSWTLDYNIAKFFATRFRKPNPKIYKAKVNINDIILFIGREKEVLIESKNLKEVREVQIIY